MNKVSQKVKNCPHCGKVLPKAFWHNKEHVAQPTVKCPRCGSHKVGKTQFDVRAMERYSVTIAGNVSAGFLEMIPCKQHVPLFFCTRFAFNFYTKNA